MFERYLVKTFVESLKALRTIDLNSVGNLLSGIQFDDVQSSSLSSTQDQFDYYLDGVLQRSIEVTYTDTSKTNVSRARKI